MADTYRLLSIIMFISAGCFGIASIVVFIVLRVDRAIGNVTGITAKRTIKRQNEEIHKSINRVKRYEYEKLNLAEIDEKTTAKLNDEDKTELLKNKETEEDITEMIDSTAVLVNNKNDLMDNNMDFEIIKSITYMSLGEFDI